MKNLRREDLSLHHHIKNYILTDFIEVETNVPLTYVADVSSTGSYVFEGVSNMDPLPTTRGRGWVYLDNPSDITEQTGSVTVYDNNSAVINSSNYDVDYIDGRIICASSSIIPSYVDYRWNYVALVDEWQAVEASDVPVVAIGVSNFAKEGFQLGGGKYVSRRIDLHIFASNQAEKDDLTECLYDGLYLKCCNYQIFPKGTMIDWDGRFNSNYEFATISGSSNLKFEDVSSKTINATLIARTRLSTMLTDLNRYRSRISFSMIHWEERS